jgi:hypothetical protein
MPLRTALLPPTTTDNVEITGVVVARWRPLYPGWRADAELLLRACHMRVEARLPQPSALLGVEMGELFRCVTSRLRAAALSSATMRGSFWLSPASWGCRRKGPPLWCPVTDPCSSSVATYLP